MRCKGIKNGVYRYKNGMKLSKKVQSYKMGCRVKNGCKDLKKCLDKVKKDVQRFKMGYVDIKMECRGIGK